MHTLKHARSMRLTQAQDMSKINKDLHKSISHKSVKSNSSKHSKERTFTINNVYHVDGCPTKFSHADNTGRYIGKIPSRAASKALTNLCDVKNIRGQCTLYIEMRETTQGSSHKLFAYHCKRVHLKSPVEINGRVFNYTNKIKSVSIPTEACPKSHKSSGRMVGYHSKMRSSYKSKHKKPSNKHTKKSKSIVKRLTNSMTSLKKSVKSIFK